MGTLSNASAIGWNATATASNSIVIGDLTSITWIGGVPGWSIYSDGRFKDDLKEDVPGLEFITRLRPVTYVLNNRKLGEHIYKNMPDSIRAGRMHSMEEYRAAIAVRHTGFVAQDVERIAKEIGYDFDGVHMPQNETDTYSLAYGEFVVPLVKAIQEQQKIIEDQNARIGKQKMMIAGKNSELDHQQQTIDELIRQVGELEK